MGWDADDDDGGIIDKIDKGACDCCGDNRVADDVDIDAAAAPTEAAVVDDDDDVVVCVVVIIVDDDVSKLIGNDIAATLLGVVVIVGNLTSTYLYVWDCCFCCCCRRPFKLDVRDVGVVNLLVLVLVLGVFWFEWLLFRKINK